MMNADLRGKPDAGNPHVRFDEGEVVLAKPSRGVQRYKTLLLFACSVLTIGLLAATGLDGLSFKVPKVCPCDALSKDGLQALWIEGEPWKGKPTWVFAYLALPEGASASNRVPGVVLAHGGGGTAYPSWPKTWAKHGYAAIVVDTCGHLPVKPPEGKWNEWVDSGVGGPHGWGRPDLGLEPASDQWPYHAVGALVRAHSYLRTRAEVDPEKTGLTGISWGGFLTMLTAGVDGRFKFAMPVYACAFYEEIARIGRLGTALRQQLPADVVARWDALFDPVHYVPRMKMPVFWFASSNDVHFPFDTLQRTTRLVSTMPGLAIRVNMVHSHGPAGENMPELFRFADQIVRGAPPLPSVGEPKLENGILTVSADAKGDAFKRVDLNWCADDPPVATSVWNVVRHPAPSGAVFRAPVPASAKRVYVNFVLEGATGEEVYPEAIVSSPAVSSRALSLGAAPQKLGKNPLFEGWYADPQIRQFGKTFWIYPTTSDDFAKQTYFDCFSSPDLKTWTKHAKVLTTNAISWARGCLWAPDAIEKDGKYYLIFSANNAFPVGNKPVDGEPQKEPGLAKYGGIGIAVADRPEGPYRDLIGKPLIDRFWNCAQPIDQYVFSYKGEWYMVYGGWGKCNLVRLADDFKSLVPFEDGRMWRPITPPGYTEGSVMFERKGVWYFMYSHGNWGADDYGVRYATASSPFGPFTYRGDILGSQRPLATGAGHHSVLCLPGTDDWYICYHRRPIPNMSRDHRVTCLDRMYFNEDGTIRPVVMTSSPVLASGGAKAEESVDVLVVGAGPAGIGAALAAAKTGAKTVVLERYDTVGGTTVSAEVTEIGLFHAWRRQVIAGPCWNLISNLCVQGHGRLPDASKQNGDRNWTIATVHVEPKQYAAAAKRALIEAGCDVCLSATATEIVRTGDWWTVTYRTPAGERCVSAREVVDATGSATIAARAGAARRQSPPESRQPGSFFFWWNTAKMTFDADRLDRAQKQAVADGSLLKTDVFIKMSEYVRNGGGWGTYVPLADDSCDAALRETRRKGAELKARLRTFLRRQPGLEEAEIVRSAPEVGVRETYTVVGEEMVTEDDFLNGPIYPDTVSWSFWMVDPHDARSETPTFKFHEDGKVGTIRLKAMMPKGVRHLLVAGRAISSDHAANSGLRVQASCMAIGQAAGVAASLAAQRKVDVRDLPLEDVKRTLKDLGALVPETKDCQVPGGLK